MNVADEFIANNERKRAQVGVKKEELIVENINRGR